MKQLARTGRSAAKCMALFSLLGLSMTTGMPSAYAQYGAKPLGAVLTVPLSAIGPIYAANALQNNVNLLHVSQLAIGGWNTQVATVGISQRNSFGGGGGGGGLVRCKLPTWCLPWVKQVNDNTTIIDQTAIGNGNSQVATVDVAQSNAVYTPGLTRFLQVPASWLPSLSALNQENFNAVHVSQLAVGNYNTQVALVSVDQSNSAGLYFYPSMVGALSQLNNNVAVVDQTAIGDGNTQVAVVNVNQSNG